MTAIFIAAILAIGPSPRIAAGPHGHDLVLTREMLQALDRWEPGFRPWRDRDYQPGIVRTFEFTSYQAPFAILGDFNGDGAVDAAIDGRTTTHMLSVVLLSAGSAYNVIVLSKSRGVVDPAREWYGTNGRREYGLWIFLRRRIPAGAKLTVVDGRPVTPKYESFETEAWEKATSAFYWDGKSFRRVQTSD